MSRIARIVLATAALCFCLAPMLAIAGPPDPPAEAELPSLSRLVIVSGPAELTGALPSLTPDARLIAANFENATALTDRSTLVVGVKSDQPKGTVLARIEHRGDCPINATFMADPQLTAIPPETIRKALTTWTRIRRDAIDAPVLRIVDFQTFNGHHWDISLSMPAKVSSR